MSKARDLANAGTALGAVSATELAFVDGVTSAIQTQIDAKTAKSTLTTTGDIYYASAANTPARLGIGSTDQVLKVTAGVPAWATPAAGGSMTLLSTTSLTGSTTTVSSISQAYKNLYIQIDEAAVGYAGWALSVSPNASAIVDQTGQYGTTNYSQLGGTMKLFNGGLNTSGNDTPTFSIYINNYTDAFGYRMPFQFFGSFADTSISLCGSIGGGCWRGNAAITSLDFITSNSTFTGGAVRIYGVN